MFARHDANHQVLMIVRKHEWIPVLYDGKSPPSQSIYDAASAACLSLQYHLCQHERSAKLGKIKAYLDWNCESVFEYD